MRYNEDYQGFTASQIHDIGMYFMAKCEDLPEARATVGIHPRRAGSAFDYLTPDEIAAVHVFLSRVYLLGESVHDSGAQGLQVMQRVHYFIGVEAIDNAASTGELYQLRQLCV